MKGMKTGGRKKGTPNKVTTEIRKQIAEVLTTHFTPEKVTEDLEAVEPKERLQILIKLIDYTTPKLRQTDLNSKIDDNVITVLPPNFEFTPEQRKERIQELKEKLFDEAEP